MKEKDFPESFVTKNMKMQAAKQDIWNMCRSKIFAYNLMVLGDILWQRQ